MQQLIFIRRSHGVSKKGKDYDMIEVSNGLSSFTLSCADGIGEQIEEKYSEGDTFNATVEVNVAFGALRGTITEIE